MASITAHSSMGTSGQVSQKQEKRSWVGTAVFLVITTAIVCVVLIAAALGVGLYTGILENDTGVF